MRLQISFAVVLIAVSAGIRTDSQVTGPLGSGSEEAYASEIRVEPDTLYFVWSQIEGYSLLAAGGIEEYVTSHPLMNAIDRIQGTESMTDLVQVVAESGKQGIDTLQPPWEGPFFVGWSAPFRIEYEATQLIPSQPAHVIGLIHGVASPAPNLSKQCSLFVWDGRGARPGRKLHGASVTASVQEALTVYLNYYTTPSIVVDGPFWVGNYEMDTLYPTSALDSTMSYLNVYADPDSKLWHQDQVEYFHGAIVSYDAISDTLKTMTVYNDGDSTLDVSNLVSDQSWVVSVSPISFSVAPGGNQSVTVEVSRDGLGSGTYEALLTIYSDDPSDSTYEQPIQFVVNTVDVAEEVDYPSSPPLSLRMDPNPMKGGGTIYYETPEESHVGVSIFDRSGRLVVDLVSEVQQSGTGFLYWDGRDGSGKDLPAGIYFCRLSAYPVLGGAQKRRTIKFVILD